MLEGMLFSILCKMGKNDLLALIEGLTDHGLTSQNNETMCLSFLPLSLLSYSITNVSCLYDSWDLHRWILSFGSPSLPTDLLYVEALNSFFHTDLDELKDDNWWTENSALTN